MALGLRAPAREARYLNWLRTPEPDACGPLPLADAEAVPGGIPGFSVAHELLARSDGQIVSYLCPVGSGQVRQLEARGYLIPDNTDMGVPWARRVLNM
jgi:hypothetical protein